MSQPQALGWSVTALALLPLLHGPLPGPAPELCRTPCVLRVTATSGCAGIIIF